MPQDRTEKPPEGGLELDKIDVQPPPASPRAAAGGDVAAQPSPKAGGKGWLRWTLLGAAAAILGLTLGIATLHLKKAAQPSGKEAEVPVHKEPAPEIYQSIGPIYATLANKEVVFLVVQVRCPTEADRKKLSEMESLLKDGIIAVMGDPETEKLFIAKDYDGLRARIRDGISAMVQEPIGEVYFSQFLRF